MIVIPPTVTEIADIKDNLTATLRGNSVKGDALSYWFNNVF